MTSFNPLAQILKENKLNGNNYVDWKRNLDIVLTAEGHKFVLYEEFPPKPNDDAPAQRPKSRNQASPHSTPASPWSQASHKKHPTISLEHPKASLEKHSFTLDQTSLSLGHTSTSPRLHKHPQIALKHFSGATKKQPGSPIHLPETAKRISASRSCLLGDRPYNYP